MRIRTLIGLTAVFGCWFTTARAQSPTFYEHDGLVVVECESVAPAQYWQLRTDSYVVKSPYTVAGHTGNGCYQFMGNAQSGGAVAGIMTYSVHIQTPGTYKVWMRVMEAPVETGAGDQGNDCYIRMVGQVGCEGTFTKYVVLDESYRWSWNVKLECSTHSFSDASYELAAGTYQFQIAGRSKYFIIDRFVMARSGVTVSPADIDLPESPTDPNTEPLPLITYDMRGLDFPYTGTGFVPQAVWVSLDPADADRQATVGKAFAHASGRYNIRLYCVAEDVGRSTYRLWVGDALLGTYQVPLTDQATELGIDFRGTWDNVQVNTGDEIRVEASAGTLNNTTWTRAGWQKVSFMPLFDPTRLSLAPTPRAPARASADAGGRVYSLDGRMLRGAAALAARTCLSETARGTRHLAVHTQR